jgi:hypothetical protein
VYQVGASSSSGGETFRSDEVYRLGVRVSFLMVDRVGYLPVRATVAALDVLPFTMTRVHRSSVFVEISWPASNQIEAA